MWSVKKRAASILSAGLIYVFGAAAAAPLAPAVPPPAPSNTNSTEVAKDTAPPEDFTCKVERDPETGKLVGEYYLQNGVSHRTDGPAIVRYDLETGRVVREEYWTHGIPNRADGPALIDYDSKTGQILNEEYWRNARLHREGDTPAVLQYDYSSGKKIIVLEMWWHNGYSDRDIGPQTIERDDKTGNVIAEEYWHHGKCDRNGAPAKLEYDPVKGKDGLPLKEMYYRASGLDRVDGPAIIIRDPATQRVIVECYGRNGGLHRNGGPAVVEYSSQTGKIIHEEYWRNGQQVEAPKSLSGPKP